MSSSIDLMAGSSRPWLADRHRDATRWMA